MNKLIKFIQKPALTLLLITVPKSSSKMCSLNHCLTKINRGARPGSAAEVSG